MVAARRVDKFAIVFTFTESVQKSLEKMFGKGGSIPIRASDEFAKRMGVSDVVSCVILFNVRILYVRCSCITCTDGTCVV